MLQTHPSALLTPPSWYSRHTPFLYSTQMLYKIITAYHIWIYGSQVDAPTIECLTKISVKPGYLLFLSCQSLFIQEMLKVI